MPSEDRPRKGRRPDALLIAALVALAVLCLGAIAAVAVGLYVLSSPPGTIPMLCPQPVCTPPACDEHEYTYCPDDCPGGCGIICATYPPTRTPAATATPSPSPTATATPAPSNTPTLPPTETPAATDTPSPAAPTPESATPASAPPTRTSAPFSVSVTPERQSVPAGASISFNVAVPEWSSHDWPDVLWSVAGLPSNVRTEFLPGVHAGVSTLVVHTGCSAPPGEHAIDVLGTLSQTTSSARPTIQIGDPLPSSQSGTFSGSFLNAETTVDVYRGGPSTLRYGPFRVLHFCDGEPPRQLQLIVESATSEAGTELEEPPLFSLFHSLVWPAPASIQTVGGAYQTNAREVARSDGATLTWDVEPGLYLLVFQRSPFEDLNPPAERPASVTYRVEITSLDGSD